MKSDGIELISSSYCALWWKESVFSLSHENEATCLTSHNRSLVNPSIGCAGLLCKLLRL